MKPAASCSLRLLALVVLMLATAAGARGQATNVYITQTGATTGICTTGVQNPAWFNNAANWGTGAGQIGPGTVVHLCGIITTTLALQGNGAAGNPFTILFDTGARISHPYCGDDGGFGCFTIANHSFFIVDGGTPCGYINFATVPCNGIIEATANGTGLANQSSLGNTQGCAVNTTNSHDWEFRNITIQNIYVRIPNSGDHSGALSEGFLGFSPLFNVHIHNIIAHDLHWVLTDGVQGSPISNIEFDHFYTYNVDHTVGIGDVNMNSTGFLVHDFHIGSTETWDLATTDNHHDGIHFFQQGGDTLPGSFAGVQIYNGLFDGDWGFSNTANIFIEEQGDYTIFNNIFQASSGSFPYSNGAYNNENIHQGTTTRLYNNTLIWCGTNPNPGSYMVTIGNAADVRNNAFVNCSNTGNTAMVGELSVSGGTWDYNAYASVTPTVGLFGINTTSCCGVPYLTWKSTRGNDTHSPAGNVYTPTTIGINQTTGVPTTTSPVVGTGTNLTSLGIAALNADRNGAARAGTGAWTIGAFTSGSTPPTAPIVCITPSPVAFGNQAQNTTSAPMTVMITNCGNASLVLSASFFAFGTPGTNGADFARSGGTCANNGTVAAGAGCTLLATFRPVTVGAESATLTITSNAATASVGATGTGTAVGTTSISLTPGTFSFGTVTQGTTSASSNFVVTNIGTLNVTLATPVTTFSGPNAADFTVATGGTSICTSGLVLTPGQTCNKPLQATPSTGGAESATVTVSATSATASASLTVNGQALTSVLTVAPSPVLFGSVTVGQVSATTTATVTNSGTGPVTLATPKSVLSGTNAADWTDTGTGTCTNGLVLAAGGTCTIVLTLKPTLASAETATLTVNGSGGATVATTLSGTGVAPSPVPAPIPWIFTMTCQTVPGQTKCQMPLSAAAVSLPGLTKGPYVFTVPGGLEITVVIK